MKNSDEQEDFTSLDFMTSFIKSEHKIGLNKTIECKYRDYQKSISSKQEFVSPIASKIINRILCSDKIREVDGTPNSYVPIRVKKCDIQFVGVSIQLNGILVTNDKPLIDAIESQNLTSQFTTTQISTAKTHL